MDSTNTEEYLAALQEAARVVRERLGEAEIALVLGSGLNHFTEELANAKVLRFDEIPHMPQPKVKGHAGQLVLGQIGGRNVLCLAGRVHMYEGLHMFQLTFAARLMALLGVKLMISTNASGGSAPGMFPGALMIITDHINFYKRNPLHDTFEQEAALCPSGFDFSALYSRRVAAVARQVAHEVGFNLFEGVYAATPGPTYETPAEVAAYTRFGASAFGMSTVPETMAAGAMGVEVFGLSLITNLAAGITDEELTHAAVTDVAQGSGPGFCAYMIRLLNALTPLDSAGVATRPALVADNSAIRPLPQPVRSSPGVAQLAEAAAFVRSAVGPAAAADTRVALVLAAEHRALVDNLQNAVAVDFRSIPHFPGVGASRRGQLLASKTRDATRLFCCLVPSHDGLLPEDATFLVDVLAQLGVRALVQTFVAGSTHLDGQSTAENKASLEGRPQLLFVTDVSDAACVHPVSPLLPTLPQYLPDVAPVSFARQEQLPHEKLLEELRAQVLGSDSGSSTSLTEGAYMHFPGPSYPTRAEVRLASLSGFAAAGRGSPAPLYAARARNLETAAVAELLYGAQQPSEQLESEVDSVGRLVAAVAQRLSDASAASVAGWSGAAFAEPRFPYQVTHQPNRPILQGDFDACLFAAGMVRKHLPAQWTAPLGVLLDGVFAADFLADKLTEGGSLLLRDIPNFPVAPRDSGARMRWGWLDDRLLIVLEGSRYVNEGASAGDISFGIHLLGALGAESVVLLSPLCSADPGLLPLGSLAIVRDHVMLSGRNPLFGPNQDRWGIRFPDVSTGYTRAFQAAFMAAAQALFGEAPPSVVFAHWVGPVFGSASDAAIARAAGAQAICTSLAPEMIAARHLRMRVGALGVVTAVLPASRGEPLVAPLSAVEAAAVGRRQAEALLVAALPALAMPSRLAKIIEPAAAQPPARHPTVVPPQPVAAAQPPPVEPEQFPVQTAVIAERAQAAQQQPQQQQPSSTAARYVAAAGLAALVAAVAAVVILRRRSS